VSGEPAAFRPGGAADLVPRFEEQGYSGDAVEARRQWVEERTGARLAHVGAGSIAGEAMRGNVENPVGCIQVPLGVAGPCGWRASTPAVSSTSPSPPPRAPWCAPTNGGW